MTLRAEGLHVITREERPAEGAERHHSSPLLPDTHLSRVSILFAGFQLRSSTGGESRFEESGCIAQS